MIKYKKLYGANNKACIITTEKGEYLVSYDSIVLFKSNNGKMYRTYNGDWTHTTGRHIKAYCGLNKAEYEDLKYKEV